LCRPPSRRIIEEWLEAYPSEHIGRNLTMQFSLRRMLLAVAVLVATLGTLTLHAKRLGVFRSESDPAWWWVAVTATAFAAGGILLVGHREVAFVRFV
jgi:hypothetical protein